MGSQLDMQSASLKSDPDNYQYPLIHAGAFPVESRPSKRARLGTQSLATDSAGNTSSPSWQESANFATSSQGPPGDHGSSREPMQHSNMASVPPPPAQPKRRRRKKGLLPQSSDPFIMENMTFPKHQPWLKVKPRQRRAAVQVNDSVPILPPASEAPDEGEALVLNKHADRIAALIAQKRRDNDSTQFRQRMALQQRLHRGEKDESDQAIAASHDELQRKMKLSAQGIFEERPPDGNESDFGISDRSSVESAEDVALEEFMAYRNARQDTTPSTDPNPSQDYDHPFDPHSLDASDRSDLDDGLEETEVVGVRYDSPPPPILGAYVHYNQGAYHQQTILTNRLLAVSGTAPRAHAVQVENIYSPHPHPHSHPQPYPNQYADNSPVWGNAPAQPWATHQMYHALPSTQTPELERAELTRQQMDLQDTLHHDSGLSYMHPQTHDNYDYYVSANHSSTTNTSSSSSTPAAGPSRMNYQVTLPSSSTPAAEAESIMLRSNVNMFTRQARENGVIGGNNNVVLPTTTRRNMFDRN